MLQPRWLDYVRKYKDQYPYDAIKSVLMQDGATAAEADEAVRLAAAAAAPIVPSPPPPAAPPPFTAPQGWAAGPASAPPVPPAYPQLDVEESAAVARSVAAGRASRGGLPWRALLLAGLAACVWRYRDRLPVTIPGVSKPAGAFDAAGKPKAIIFTVPNCEACTFLTGKLRDRGVPFEEVNGESDEGKKRLAQFGGNNAFPHIAVGNAAFTFNGVEQTESILAENLGYQVLPLSAQRVMKNHFDADGKPRMVLYGTTWCPWCNKIRGFMDGRKIPYTFVNVESSEAVKQDFEAIGGRGFPLIYCGYRRIDGYSEEKVVQAAQEVLKVPL